MNNNESTEMINNRFLKAKTIEDAEKLDEEYNKAKEDKSKKEDTPLKKKIYELCKKRKKPINVLIDELTIPKTNFYNRINGQSAVSKGFIIEVAFNIGGVSFEELSELFKIANLGQLDAKRNQEDRYVLMFFGRNIDEREHNKKDYDIWELEQLLKQKITYENRKIKFSVTEEY
ncbi:MAG: hypothetical protein IKT55_02110 [Clostridia bacterium]|nr:hypothetical protein [Clostridia bacterium]